MILLDETLILKLVFLFTNGKTMRSVGQLQCKKVQEGRILSSSCYKRINAGPSEASSSVAFGSSSMRNVSHDYGYASSPIVTNFVVNVL